MAGKLRVFISSTMSDLANERDAVVRKLRSFNFEPVNAEDWAARHERPWDRIEEEIRSSDLFVLILGERYGFEPEEGPGAAEGQSVTHLEYRVARDVEKMPVLVFMKHLDFETAPKDERRDDFRNEVRKWNTGHLTVKFMLAVDLAEKVAASIMETLSDAWTKARVRSRAEDVARIADVIATPPEDEPVIVPKEVRVAIAQGKALLVAGAGMSLEAGLPDARLYNETLLQHNVEADPNYWRGPAASLESIAEDYELTTSRQHLIEAVFKMMSPPHGSEPSASHEAAVRLFPTIVTTNFDRMFETAAEQGQTGHRQVNRARGLGAEPRIVHLRGCIDDPSSLALTETDLERDWRSYWWDLRDAMRDSFLIVIGTSLNDPTLMGLLQERKGADIEYGCYVAPGVHAASLRRVEALKLRHVTATAAGFFAALTAGEHR